MSWPQSGSAGGSTYSPSLQQQQQHSSNPNTSPSAVVGPDFSSLPATSPTHQPNAAAEAAGSGAGRKRKHSESKGPSPEHDGDGAAGQQAQKPHPVKRACNECRQQKLRCNITTEPDFKPCTRCLKHNLHCAIDPNFRRQEKRQRTVEMERELEQLKAENAELRMARGLAPSSSMHPPFPAHPPYAQAAAGAQFPSLSTNEAAASRSLLDLSQGAGYEGMQFGPLMRQPTLNSFGRVVLTDNEVAGLFATYFQRFHPYLPLLPTDLPYTAFFNMHPLLYWSIITVASRHYGGHAGLLQELKEPLQDLLWFTVSRVPQTYHVVKALCLICAWPLPTNSTSSDPSMMICGAMIQLAMQFGLHRPSHAQDFSRFKIELREEDIRDRMNTWVVCNLVAQNISTGYGMPQVSRWNWFTHGLHLDRISQALVNRCMIERFIEKVTRALYTMQRDEVGPSDEVQRALTIDTFGREYEEIKTSIQANNPTPIDTLHVHIAGLHLRLTALFDNPEVPNYRDDVRRLYLAATTLLTTFITGSQDAHGPMPTTTLPKSPNESSMYAPNYIMQMILAAGFTLLKVLNSFFANNVDVPGGRNLLIHTVTALRNISVERNDLPQRLAEVLAQLWQSSPQGQGKWLDNSITKKEMSSLQLKVRCRMSMSLLYDSVWRWKDQMGAQASKNLDRAVINPTIPAAASTSSNSSSVSAPPTSGAMTVMQHPDDMHATSGISSADGNDPLGMNGLDAWPSDMNFGALPQFDSLGLALDSLFDVNGINGEGFMGF